MVYLTTSICDTVIIYSPKQDQLDQLNQSFY